jgi:hypothetical protein
MPDAIITFPDGRKGRVRADTPEALRAQVDNVTRSFAGQQGVDPNTVGPGIHPETTRQMDPRGTPVKGTMGQVMRNIGLDPRVPNQPVLDEVATMAEHDPYRATVDTMATLGTGVVAMPVAGLAGIVGTAAGMKPGGESPNEKANRYLQNTAGVLTHDPATLGAQLLFNQQNEVAEKITTMARDYNFENPILATIVETAIGAATMGRTGQALNTSRLLARDAKKAVDDMAARLGIDIGTKNMREQAGDAAAARTVEYRGENMAAVQDKLRAEYASAKAKTQAAYDAAGETRAAMRVQSVEEFSKGVQLRLHEQGYDLSQMPALRSVIEDTEKIYDPRSELYTSLGIPEGMTIDITNLGARLKHIETLRRRTNKEYATNPAQEKAMGVFRRALDNKIKQDFDKDMILGDPAAVQAWKDARLTREMQGELFDDHDVIMRLVEREATSVEMRQWVMGASTISGRAGSGAVINQLKRILGENSPEFRGLKEEYRYDIMEPLLQRTPDFGKFLKNYERANTKNHDLVEALKPYDTDNMEELVRVIKAAEETGADPNLSLNMNRIISQAFFGHEIAQAAMRRSLAEAVIARLRGTAAGGKRKMYQELMRYDPNTAMIPKNSLAFAAIVSGHMSDVFSTDLEDAE